MNALRRLALAVRLDLRDLRRRPLILVLLIVTPYLFISRAIANTEPLARTIELANGTVVNTTMRDLHGADMTLIAVAFLAGLVGVFIMGAARQADGRLARAGYGAATTVLARLSVLVMCTAVIVGISLATTARGFHPEHWRWFTLGNLVIALTFASIGALGSVLFGRVGATYLILFFAMLDLGVVQNPMFGSGTPPRWGQLLPGYPGARVVMNAALSPTGGAPFPVILAMFAWLAALVTLTVWRLSAGLHDRR